MQRFREFLALALLVVLPFHALLMTVSTRLLAGPGHQPLRMLALWKEGVLGLILLLALAEIFRTCMEELRSKNYEVRIDAVDFLILAFIALSVIVSFGVNAVPLKQFLYGVKYDLVPLIAFLILRRVPWSDAWWSQVRSLLMIAGGLIVAYGLLTLFLPQALFTWLGYSDMHSLYFADGPIAAFQNLMGSSWRRMQSVMSGPNQLGIWLLIPWGCVIAEGAIERKFAGLWVYGFAGLLLLGLLLTFSRAAWIGAFVMFIVALWQSHALLKARFSARTTKHAAVGAMSIAIVVIIVVSVTFPQVILRLGSSREHLQRPLQAVHTIIQHPLGLGLGSAGPVSNLTSDTCVYLEEGSDSSWAKARPDLCVFVGKQQTQPAHACNCPVLPENWYLQIGIELGIVGFIVYLMLVFLFLRKLHPPHSPLPTFLIFLGICVAGLFLHAFEDSAVAYTMWVMLAASIARTQ